MNMRNNEITPKYAYTRRTIARRIIQLRELKGMSQEQLANASFLSLATLVELESSTSLKDISLCSLYVIAQELTVDIKNLFVPGMIFQPSPYYGSCKGLYCEISKSVIDKRQLRRLSAPQLGFDAGVHVKVIMEIERIARPVSLKQLIKISHALKIGPLDLF